MLRIPALIRALRAGAEIPSARHAASASSLFLADLSLYIESELDHVTILHDIVLTFNANLASGFRFLHGTCVDKIVK